LNAFTNSLRRQVALLQTYFDQQETPFLVSGGERVAELPWGERPKAAPAPAAARLSFRILTITGV
jgi:hypothetical protein